MFSLKSHRKLTKLLSPSLPRLNNFILLTIMFLEYFLHILQSLSAGSEYKGFRGGGRGLLISSWFIGDLTFCGRSRKACCFRGVSRDAGTLEGVVKGYTFF